MKPSKVLSQKFQDRLLSVFVAELSANFERQLFVDISQEIINTRSTELDLSKARRHQELVFIIIIILDLPSPHIDPSTPSQISEDFHP